MVAGGNQNFIIYGVVPRLTFEWSGGRACAMSMGLTDPAEYNPYGYMKGSSHALENQNSDPNRILERRGDQEWTFTLTAVGQQRIIITL